MSKKGLLSSLLRYRSSARGSATRKNYLRNFLPKMLYRTTKTENPETTRKMVSLAMRKRA
ncbi:MAG: hypothetical protein WC802_04170 [Patescibacteria group bacterium]